MNTAKRVKKQVPTSDTKDRNDDNQQRWGRERHEGFKIGRWMQAPPMLFTADHHPMWLGDIYRGRSAFLILGGPSFSNVDSDKLKQPGMLTMGVNNSPRSFRPNLWTSVDSPSHFIKSIWLDPTIQKFVPICHTQKKIFDNDKWEFVDMKVQDCPNVVYYKRNEHFKHRQFLWEDSFNWGNHKKHGGGRSIMLVAIRLLFHMGIRKIYLLGCDFKMDENSGYHFEQDRHSGSIRGNNSTYNKLNERFDLLRPQFEKNDLQVFNCNPDSGLKSFDFVDYDIALRRCRAEFGNIDIENERTKGLYDIKDEDKKKGIGK
jgi:hypothetical protein